MFVIIHYNCSAKKKLYLFKEVTAGFSGNTSNTKQI